MEVFSTRQGDKKKVWLVLEKRAAQQDQLAVFLKEALNQEGCKTRLNVKVKTIIYVLINAEELLGKYL